MKNLEVIRKEAISAVRNDERLIADVAAEYGISRRQLYHWLSAKPQKSFLKDNSANSAEEEIVVLKVQLRMLLTEVQTLKSQLCQYKNNNKGT